MPRLVIKLTDFDPEPIVEYAITNADLKNIYRYLQVMQAHLTNGTWADICLGSYYGTSALLHEVVELRLLLNRDPYLLIHTDAEIKQFVRHSRNRDAHLRGLEVEYQYLQQRIYHVFNERIDIGALLKANSKRPGDWYDLFDTELPFFDPSDENIRYAEKTLARLRSLGRRIY
jgi:hypothetical protein